MKAKIPISFLSILIFGFMAAAIYMSVRILFLFLLTGYNPVEMAFAVLLILAELFVLIHGIGYIINIFKSRKKTEFASPVKMGIEPRVAILVASRHEPRWILENTFISIKNLNYKNKEIYFLDDSSDESYKSEADGLASELGLIIFRRDKRRGAKAGIINDCLKGLDHEYIAIFDADQNPLPEFLNSVIPILEADKRLAFVQTPQFYTNIENNRVARGAGFQQAVFYEYICEGKGTHDSMFCCGTNVVFRAEALRSVGGLDETTVTEDFATSLKLHSSGWKSLYYDHVYAFGMGPTDLAGYFKQQFRWANGTITVLRRVILKLITKPRSLSISQWWEYILSSSYYFIGLAYFFLMFCPILYLLFRVPSFFVNPEAYVFSYIPYILLSMGIFYTLLGSRNYKLKDLLCGQLLGVCAFPVYIKGSIFALFGLKSVFGITGKASGKPASFIHLWPQLTLILLYIISIEWGINRFIHEREPAILVNAVWALYHLLVLSSIFYFNQRGSFNIACKMLPSNIKFEYRILNDIIEVGNLSRLSWQLCFKAHFSQKVACGSLVTCKLYLSKDHPVIFEARVIDCSLRAVRGKYEVALGVSVVPESDKDNLRKLLGQR
ncbi:MAG: glycosyltransferase family 2 protein [Candidatus Omnitrophica bacterium]|nr:glycosyltransferase family 2 protein [Candidatus Omnitrophota bacterium]